MRTMVTNSMIFNQNGTFKVEEVNKQQFFEILKEAWGKNQLKSYIGYVDTMNYIRLNTGVKLNITKKKLSLRHGDRVAVIKRKYIEGKDWKRFDNNEYEFFLVRYQNETKDSRQPKFGHNSVLGQ